MSEWSGDQWDYLVEGYSFPIEPKALAGTLAKNGHEGWELCDTTPMPSPTNPEVVLLVGIYKRKKALVQKAPAGLVV